jgi:muconolactone delta-isomerase
MFPSLDFLHSTDSQHREGLTVKQPSKHTQTQTETLRQAEVATSQALATESILKPIDSSNSWWSKVGLWSRADPTEKKDSTTKDSKTQAGGGGG